MSHIPRWTLADRLRKVRREAHLTQAEMADALGIRLSSWSSWESGHNRPDDPVAVAMLIESHFDVPAAWVLGLLHESGVVPPVPHPRPEASALGSGQTRA